MPEASVKDHCHSVKILDFQRPTGFLRITIEVPKVGPRTVRLREYGRVMGQLGPVNSGIYFDPEDIGRLISALKQTEIVYRNSNMAYKEVEPEVSTET